MTPAETPADVLNFWFKELTPNDWFSGTRDLDENIRSRFTELRDRAKVGELKAWRETPEGRLAEIIVLDQFSRNIFRGQPQAFDCDELALQLARDAVRVGADQGLTPQQRQFLYMPYMHSESKHVHEQAVQLFSAPGLEYNLDYELMHKKIIDRFGRYPHRNKVLGRKSTAEEIEFLKQPGSTF